MIKRLMAIAIIAAASMVAGSALHGQEAPGDPFQQDPGDGSGPGGGCSIPQGYTWGCGYSCSTTGGQCLCRENDLPRSICMKSNSGSGCGCFDHASDPCCGAPPAL